VTKEHLTINGTVGEALGKLYVEKISKAKAKNDQKTSS
jgi:predicted metalloendopeptidase